jgi:hypothetical protein
MRTRKGECTVVMKWKDDFSIPQVDKGITFKTFTIRSGKMEDNDACKERFASWTRCGVDEKE